MTSDIVYGYVNNDGIFYYIGRGRKGREIENHKRIKVPSNRKNIIIFSENLSKKESSILEKYLIKLFGRKLDGGVLENISNGGQVGSAGVPPWNKGKKCAYVAETNKRRAGKNHPYYGIKRPESHCEKIKEGLKKAKELGRLKVSDERKKKQSDLMKGIPKSEEHKKAMSVGRKGMKFTNEHKKNWRISNQKYEYVLRSPDGLLLTFRDVPEFCKNNDLFPASVHKLCNPKKYNWKNYKGWTFVSKTKIK